MRRISVLAASALLAGCTSASTDPPCALPELVPYDDAFLAHAAAELDAASDECYLCEMVIDYGRLRAQVRAIRGTE